MSEWDSVIQKARPHLVKIATPSGFGTGFLCMFSTSGLCGIATAHHVVSDAEEWQQPIRVHSHDFASNVFLKESDRVIFSDPNTDSAVVLFAPQDLKFPETTIPLRPIDSPLSLGAEVGWLGYPHLEATTLCFFSGFISARRHDRRAYLVDGVAINGVSGGPVLYSSQADGVQFVGIVTAYRANRLQGDALPGLLVAQDVSHFQQVIGYMKSIEDAKAKKAAADIEASQKSGNETAPPTPTE
jgi:Trypsin-like peptidase domain